MTACWLTNSVFTARVIGISHAFSQRSSYGKELDLGKKNIPIRLCT